MPTVHVTDAPLLFFYGNSPAFVLTDGFGEAEITALHLPLPLPAGRSVRHGSDPRDPFADSERPLRLTLASDVASSRSDVQNRLLALSRLPHVVLDVMPGVEPGEWGNVGVVTIERQEEGIDVRTSRRPDAVFGEFYGDGHADVVAKQLHLSRAQAEPLAVNLAAHQALANDYLVSPSLAPIRTTGSWFQDAGICTVDEAFFLAGVKARMYRMVPANPRIDLRVNFNTGRWYEITALQLSRPLEAALAGALSPSTTSDEQGCVDHLLAIRARLYDLLVSRDELVRLERREALGKDWPRSSERTGPVAGGSGNDLLLRTRYHVSVALNALTTVLDNLAGVVNHRERLGATARDVGIDKLVGSDRGWSSTRARGYVVSAAGSSGAIRRALALRELRNYEDHRTGFTYGWVTSIRGQALTGPEMLAVWLTTNGPHFRQPGGSLDSAAAALVDIAALAFDDWVLLRPRRIVEAALASAARMASELLALYEWSDPGWIRAEERYADLSFIPRRCHGRWQRSLWGWDLIPSALRPKGR